MPQTCNDTIILRNSFRVGLNGVIPSKMAVNKNAKKLYSVTERDISSTEIYATNMDRAAYLEYGIKQRPFYLS